MRKKSGYMDNLCQKKQEKGLNHVIILHGFPSLLSAIHIGRARGRLERKKPFFGELN